MKQKVQLYDPHPGFAGASARLPESMRIAAEDLNGQKMSLEDTLDALQPIAQQLNCQVRIVDKYNYIGFLWQEGDCKHLYRLLRYK